MKVVEWLHEGIVHPARITNLARELGGYVPDGSTLLDVGCGDGRLAALISANRGLKDVCGADVLIRPDVSVPVVSFDGIGLPFDDSSWDYVMAVDVLHHADDPEALLRDMLRVARSAVLIKDHLCESPIDRWLLRRMDKVGNDRHGVPIPAKYLSAAEWRTLFTRVEATATSFVERVSIYPWPLSQIFGRRLHCLISLSPARTRAADLSSARH